MVDVVGDLDGGRRELDPGRDGRRHLAEEDAHRPAVGEAQPDVAAVDAPKELDPEPRVAGGRVGRVGRRQTVKPGRVGEVDGDADPVPRPLDVVEAPEPVAHQVGRLDERYRFPFVLQVVERLCPLKRRRLDLDPRRPELVSRQLLVDELQTLVSSVSALDSRV